MASLDVFWVIPYVSHDGAVVRFCEYPQRPERGHAHARGRDGIAHQRGVQQTAPAPLINERPPLINERPPLINERPPLIDERMQMAVRRVGARSAFLRANDA